MIYDGIFMMLEFYWPANKAFVGIYDDFGQVLIFLPGFCGDFCWDLCIHVQELLPHVKGKQLAIGITIGGCKI